MINEGRSKGAFLLQSPGQLKTGQGVGLHNLLDLAYQVAIFRPGVGTQGRAISQSCGAAPTWRRLGPRPPFGAERAGVRARRHRLVDAGRPVADRPGGDDCRRGRRRAFARPNDGSPFARTGDVPLIPWPRSYLSGSGGVGQPVAPGPRHGLSLGRDHQCHRVQVGAPLPSAQDWREGPCLRSTVAGCARHVLPPCVGEGVADSSEHRGGSKCGEMLVVTPRPVLRLAVRAAPCLRQEASVIPAWALSY